VVKLLNDLLPQNDSPIFCRVSINNDEKWVHGIITYINMEKRDIPFCKIF